MSTTKSTLGTERPWTREQQAGSATIVKKHAKTIPVVLVVVSLVVVSMVLPVIVGVALTTVTGNSKLRESTRSAAATQSNGIALLLNERLEIAERTAKQLYRQYNSLSINVSDFVAGRSFSMSAVRELGRCSAVYLSTPEGYLNGALQTADHRYAIWISYPNQTACQIPVNEMMQQINTSDWCSKNYFSNDSTWFRVVDSRVDGDNSWTPLYYTTHEAYVTYSISAYVNGKFIGVTSVDWILGSISSILEGINSDGIGVLLEKDSEIFLGSTDKTLNAGGVNQTTGEIVILTLPEVAVKNALLLSAQQAVMKIYGSWGAAANKTFWSDDGSVISITPIEKNGLVWLLAVISHPNFILVDPAALGSVLGITVALVIIAVICSWLFVRPINALSSDMSMISQLEFSARRTKQSLSRLREIRDMQKSFLRLKTGTRALTRYVPSEVVMDVMRSDSGDLKLDMQLVPLAILFTDLKGFTSMSEELPHDVLISILNQWFQEFGKVIQTNDGVIDKFIGDCIMALFGAPHPVEHPELSACRTAWGFRQAMEKVNGYAILHGTSPIEYRVGIHTGKVLVGHLGYAEHVNYTVCGNAANVASRMEQLGKEYNITPLISGDVKRKVEEEFNCVLIDVVFLRGHKTVRTQVYHLLGPKQNASQAELAIVEHFNAIHEAVRAGETNKALSLVDTALVKQDYANYTVALHRLQDHIKSGATCRESYTEHPAEADAIPEEMV